MFRSKYIFLPPVLFLSLLWEFSFYKLLRLKRKIKVASIVRFKEEEKLSKDRVGKWGEIKNKINSDSMEDWKEAIIMVDSILDDIYSRMGYKMDGLGKN